MVGSFPWPPAWACTPVGDRLRVAGMMEFRSPRRRSTGGGSRRSSSCRPLPAGADPDNRKDEWVGSRPCTSDGPLPIGVTANLRGRRAAARPGHHPARSSASALASSRSTGLVPRAGTAAPPTRLAARPQRATRESISGHSTGLNLAFRRGWNRPLDGAGVSTRAGGERDRAYGMIGRSPAASTPRSLVHPADGASLLRDVNLRAGGQPTAPIGPNGTGKTTLIRLIGGRPAARTGPSFARWGSCASSSGQVRDDKTVRDLLLMAAADRCRAAAEIDRAELAMMEATRRPTRWPTRAGAGRLGRCRRLRDRDVGTSARWRRWARYTTRRRAQVTTLGGEQKRFVLEASLRGPRSAHPDEPDNYPTCRARWLRRRWSPRPKTGALHQPRPRVALPRGRLGSATEPNPAGATICAIWVVTTHEQVPARAQRASRSLLRRCEEESGRS